jgi:hypothetical protein
MNTIDTIGNNSIISPTIMAPQMLHLDHRDSTEYEQVYGDDEQTANVAYTSKTLTVHHPWIKLTPWPPTRQLLIKLLPWLSQPSVGQSIRVAARSCQPREGMSPYRQRYTRRMLTL